MPTSAPCFPQPRHVSKRRLNWRGFVIQFSLVGWGIEAKFDFVLIVIMLIGDPMGTSVIEVSSE